MYSDQYDPSADVKLTPLSIANLYHREVMDICRRGEFMGIWQLHALASILGVSLLSIYPKGVNPEIRKHLHRSMSPREKRSGESVHVMWTATCLRADAKCFAPNHFVTLVHIGCDDSSAVLD